MLLTTGQITITDLNDGLPAVYATLSSDLYVIPTDSYGENGDFTGAETTLSVLIGGVDDTPNWRITTFSSFNTTGGDAVIGTRTGPTFTVTGLTATTGTITFVASKDGYDDLVKVFSVSKNPQGQKAISYKLEVAPGSIQKNKFTNTYLPNQIEMTASQKIGNETRELLNGYFCIYEQSETALTMDAYNTLLAAGQVLADKEYIISDTEYPYVLRYRSTVAENGLTYVLAYNPKSIHIEWYEDADCTLLLDNETVQVVSDGLDSLFVDVWCPQGDKIRNQEGSITIQANIWNGTEQVVGESYKWYIMNPAATTSNMGDADGGNGWQLLNVTRNNGTTGYTTSTLKVPGASVQQNAHFKCICFYNSIKLQGAVSVSDTSDVIVCYLDGLGTFKNGQGTSTIRARLMRNTEELDSNGTIYDYTWSIYDAANNLTAFSATGKSITVNATAIESRANLHCAVTKKEI